FKTIAQLTYKELRFLQSPASIPQKHTDEISQNVDLTYLRNFCEGDETKMEKYINIFLDSVPGMVTKLKEAMVAKNMEEISLLVHTFKTRLTMMGMNKTKYLATSLEMDCKAENPVWEVVNNKTIQFIGDILTAS